MDEAPVRFVRQAGLCAAVSTVSVPRPPGRRRDLNAHTEVIGTLAEQTEVVPVRFGMVLADHADRPGTPDEPRGRADQLLERLQGTVQMNLRATYVQEQVLAEVVAATTDGRLRRRTTAPAARTLRTGTWCDSANWSRPWWTTAAGHPRTSAEVVPLVEAHRERPGAGLDHVLDVALLVDRERREVVEDRLERVAEDVHARIRLRLTGPLAAFDFVEWQAWA